MKTLICEICGGNSLKKEGDVFVCENCGTKYPVEEAKKMMMDSDEVVTVKVDESDELANLYTIARRAKDDNNAENAARYYDMILVKDPNSWEATFYVTYFKAKSCKIAQIESAAHSVTNCLKSVLTLINDHLVDNEVEQIAAVSTVYADSIIIANMLFNAAKNHYDGIDESIKGKYGQEYLDNCCAARNICYKLGDYIEEVFDGKYLGTAGKAWSAGVGMHLKLLSRFADQEKNSEIILTYAQKAGRTSKYSGLLLREQAFLNLENEKDPLITSGMFLKLAEDKDFEAVGYLGAAVALMSDGTANFEKRGPGIISAHKDVFENMSDKLKEDEDIQKLVNFTYGSTKVSALGACAFHRDPIAVKILVDLGADVNYLTTNNTNALFLNCYKSVSGKEKEEAEIARILLDAGSETNIVNTGGVSLLNDKTSEGVRALIMEKRPDTKSGKSAGNKSSGCYVATAVYGSYDCPEVWTLRRYRDYTLASSWYGRMFIHLYYAISPTIVKWFGDTQWFTNLWKPTLDKKVERLNEMGVLDTPYEDKNW